MQLITRSRNMKRRKINFGHNTLGERDVRERERQREAERSTRCQRKREAERQREAERRREAERQREALKSPYVHRERERCGERY